jgi:hypothetical protein
MVRVVAAVVLDAVVNVPMFVVEELNVPVASDNCAVNVLVDPNEPVVVNGTDMTVALPAQTAAGDSVPTVIVCANPLSGRPKLHDTKKRKQ